MTTSIRAFLPFAIAGVIAGCSAMQSTPTMPTQPARLGASGISPSEDAICRNRAQQAAEKAKEANVAKEVGATVVGIAAGALIGNALEPRRFWGPARYYGPRGYVGPVPRRPYDPGWGTAGGVTGGLTGAAASQAMVSNTREIYDRTYNNCIAAYANAGT